MLGPKQYLRRTGKPDGYSDTFPGIIGQGKVIIQNGNANGNNRVSSAVILFNGVQVFGPNDFNQQAYSLEAPINLGDQNLISVELRSSPGSYITVQVVAEITPDETSVETIGIAGGTISVQNHLGDTLTLQIPPLALNQDTSISISSLPTALPSLLLTTYIRASFLGPADLHFSLPVKIEVSPQSVPKNPAAAILYWLIDSQHILPIANQSATQNERSRFNFRIERSWLPIIEVQ